MKKSIVILLSIVLMISVLAGCSFIMSNTETTTTTTTTRPTTTKPTTTKPPTTTTTTQPPIKRDDVLPDEPTFKCTMNRYGGIKVNWQTTYRGKKEIKYYTVTFHLYNDVGDDAYDDITHKSVYTIKTVGPVSPGEKLIVYESPMLYAESCGKILIEYIKFDYMDGTSDEFWYGWQATVGFDF